MLKFNIADLSRVFLSQQSLSKRGVLFGEDFVLRHTETMRSIFIISRQLPPLGG